MSIKEDTSQVTRRLNRLRRLTDEAKAKISAAEVILRLSTLERDLQEVLAGFERELTTCIAVLGGE